MKRRSIREDLHYLKPQKWLSGELCFWRNNPNYSEATKQKLEALTDRFCRHHVKPVTKFTKDLDYD